MSYGRLKIPTDILRGLLDLPDDFRFVRVKEQELDAELEIVVEHPKIPSQPPFPEVMIASHVLGRAKG